jgi:hypothetical protein
MAVVHRSYKQADSEEIFDTKLEYGSREAALQKIRSEKKTWILNATENWLLHKQCVWKDSNDQERHATIAYCMHRLKEFYQQDLLMICKRFLKGQEKFTSILPLEANKSYAGSKHDLQEILLFCELEIKREASKEKQNQEGAAAH